MRLAVVGCGANVFGHGFFGQCMKYPINSPEPITVFRISPRTVTLSAPGVRGGTVDNAKSLKR